MKRILPAALLAIGIHGVVLNSDTFRLHNVFTLNSKPKIVTLTLIYKTTPKPVFKSSFKSFNLRPLPPIQKVKPVPKIKKVPPRPIVKQVPLAVSKKFQKPGIPSKIVSLAPEILRQFRITHPSPKGFSASRASRPATTEKPIPPEPQPVPPEAVSAQPYPMAVMTPPSTAASAAATKTAPPPLIEARPLFKKNPTPRYPRIARRRGYEGTVILEVFVDPYGRVGDLNIYKSSGYSILDRAARASVKNWHFEPGRKGNATIAMWVRIPIRFHLEGG